MCGGFGPLCSLFYDLYMWGGRQHKNGVGSVHAMAVVVEKIGYVPINRPDTHVVAPVVGCGEGAQCHEKIGTGRLLSRRSDW